MYMRYQQMYKRIQIIYHRYNILQMIISKEQQVLDEQLSKNLKTNSQQQISYSSANKTWVNIKNFALISTVSQMNVHIVQAYCNQYSQIFIQIKNISFPRLKFLNIWGNNIESIQGFARLDAPVLTDIWIWDNHIRSIRELRKISNMTLRQIDMKENPILDQQYLSQIPATTLYKLYVNPLPPRNYLAKIQPNIVKNINQSIGFYGDQYKKYAQIRNVKRRVVLQKKFITQ